MAGRCGSSWRRGIWPPAGWRNSCLAFLIGGSAGLVVRIVGILDPTAAVSRFCFGTPFWSITFQALVRSLHAILVTTSPPPGPCAARVSRCGPKFFPSPILRPGLIKTAEYFTDSPVPPHGDSPRRPRHVAVTGPCSFLSSCPIVIRCRRLHTPARSFRPGYNMLRPARARAAARGARGETRSARVRSRHA